MTSRQSGFTILAHDRIIKRKAPRRIQLSERYRHNFSRHLLGVARYLQASMMDTLQEECGHANLRLGFAPYITLIGEGEKRLTDLAEILGVSRQACNQTAKQVEAAGYIERRAHPTDRRARRLALSS